MTIQNITRDRIRQVMAERLGITQKETAKLLGISERTVWAHVQAIRAEWKSEDME